RATANDDETANAAALRKAGLDYFWDHRGRFASVVVWARLARSWDLYPDPANNVRLAKAEGRDYDVAFVAMLVYWVVAGLAIGGAVVLRRRRGPPLWPLLTPFVIVCAVAVYAYGAVRFRAIAEPSLLLLAAVAVETILVRAGRRAAPAPEVVPG